MKISATSRPRAFAVIIILVVVTVMTLLAGAFAYSMKIEARLAANSNNDEEFYWLARAGAERACWWLALEPNQFSSTQQYWAGGPGEGPETNNSPLEFESLDNYAIGTGTVSLKMIELESKFNVNSADEVLLRHILEQQGVDASRISVAADSILDWIDPDDATRPAGAESDYYQGQGGYDAKNAPIDNIDELQLIQGVTPAMFTGQSAETLNRPFPKHRLGFNKPGEENYSFALRDVLTPFSSGKVNVLTAGANVLQLLPGADEQIAQAIITARESDPPIRGVDQLLASAGIPQAVAQQMRPYLDQRGSTYEVHVSVTIGQLTHEYLAIISREPNGRNVHIFNFYRVK